MEQNFPVPREVLFFIRYWEQPNIQTYIFGRKKETFPCRFFLAVLEFETFISCLLIPSRKFDITVC